jgi:hypothetical protein
MKGIMGKLGYYPSEADPRRDAHRCWTGAMRTSENSHKAKFAEFPFHALR